MKKILEILQYGDTDIRFNTDLKPTQDPDTIPGLVTLASFAMTTSLWGGNEQDVLAVLRALNIADLAVSVNRREMLTALDKGSEEVAKMLREAQREYKRTGGKVFSFAPGINPLGMKS
ncbi:MAG: hypothetical protein K6E35_09295 [Bacteroidales bacterium]|nr:hypothetical protein [Bacteroidales bacterium]